MQHAKAEEHLTDTTLLWMVLPRQRDRPCLAFLYTPTGDPTVDAVVAGVLRNNNPPLSQDAALGLNTSAQVSSAELEQYSGMPTHTALFKPGR
jgi:hypothetical protein